MVRTMIALPLFPLSLAAVATLWLAACQGSGTDKPVASWESPKPVGSDIVPGEQPGADPQVPLPTEKGSGSQPSDGAGIVEDNSFAATSPVANQSGATGDEGVPFDRAGSSVDSVNETSFSIVLGTTSGGERLALRPRNNPMAADLLDHWRHRRVQSIVEGLGLSAPTPDADAADLSALQAAAQNRGEAVVAPDLQDGDEVRNLGSNRGVTYGRWSGGPGDTLPITFEFSPAKPLTQYDPAFRAMVERAGKAWSNRIADTYTPWLWFSGERKGTLLPNHTVLRGRS